jgi:predicted 3-demethylubiquinone-9 3-methyltransferase (glyoxalase superfamily)
MQKITPFLWFDDGCEEGINFYTSVFNGSPNKKAESKVVTIQRYPDNIPNPPWGEGMSGKVLTAVFELAGQKFMALDGGKGVFARGGSVSFLVDCENQEEIDYFWGKLTEGGDPKAQQCGWLMDKYGFSWQIVPDMEKWLNGPDKEGAKRAMQAMLQMKKIVIADLEKAYRGE